MADGIRLNISWLMCREISRRDYGMAVISITLGLLISTNQDNIKSRLLIKIFKYVCHGMILPYKCVEILLLIFCVILSNIGTSSSHNINLAQENSLKVSKIDKLISESTT